MSEYEGQPQYQQPAPGQPDPNAQPDYSQQPAYDPQAYQQPAYDQQAYQQPAANWQQQAEAPQAVRASQTGPIPSEAIAAAKAEASGFTGMFNDPSELASTGLIGAVLFAIVAGIFKFFADPVGGDIRDRLIQFTDTVDVGDVALLGIAVALLLLTPDPPGGMGRPRLLNAAAVLAAIISAYGVIRALVLLLNDGDMLLRFAGFLATLGVSLAAATVAFYAAKESFLKAEERKAG